MIAHSITRPKIVKFFFSLKNRVPHLLLVECGDSWEDLALKELQ